MNTASKKSLFFALLTSLASLTACGGGGGGGGGDALPAPRPLISVSEITGGMTRQGHLAKDYSNAGDSGGLKATLENGGLTGEFRESGIPVTIVHGNSIDVIAEYGEPHARVLKEFTFEELPQYGETGPDLVVGVSWRYMTQESMKFFDIPDYMREGVKSQKYKLGDMHNDPAQGAIYFTGTGLGGSEFLALNSGLVDLQYASFGAWGAKYGATGTLEWNGQSKTFTGKSLDAGDAFTEIAYVPVSGGDSTALKQPDANAKFTGKAIGMVTQYRGSTLDKPNQQHFENGNATLSINGARNGGDLLLEFPDFYDIAFQIKLINNNDEFENTSQAPTVTPNGGGTPFRFPGTIEDYKLSGNFYGPDGPNGFDGSASEASGRFEISARDNPTDDLFVFDGSFGVKK